MPPTSDPAADLLPHEIAGPVWYLPYPLPVMIGAGVIILLLLSVGVWALLRWRRNRASRTLTALEKALAALDAAQARASEAMPYEFSIEVCDVLRSFLGAEHRLPATTQLPMNFCRPPATAGCSMPVACRA